MLSYMRPVLVLFLLIVSFIAVSCKTEEPTIQGSQFACKLVKLANASGEYVDFTFEGEKIVESSAYDQSNKLGSKAVIIYDAKGYPSRINYYDKGNTNTDPQSYWDLTVDAQGRIVKSTQYTKKGQSATYESFWTDLFEYNNKGQIYKTSSLSTPNGYSRFEYDSNGNVIKGFSKGQDSAEYLYYEATYDNKLNPSNQNRLYGYLFVYTFFDVTTPNNLLEVKLYDANGKLFKKNSYSYQYNEKGYPVERIVTDSSSSGIRTQKNRYSYICK